MGSIYRVSLAAVGSSLVCSAAWLSAAEPSPRVAFPEPSANATTNHLQKFEEPASITFPSTSSAPLKWKARSNAQPVAMSSAEANESVAQARPATNSMMVVDGQVRPVAFTVASQSTTSLPNKPRVRTVSQLKSVLSHKEEAEVAQQPAPAANAPATPMQDPFLDRGTRPQRLAPSTPGGDFPGAAPETTPLPESNLRQPAVPSTQPPANDFPPERNPEADEPPPAAPRGLGTEPTPFGRPKEEGGVPYPSGKGDKPCDRVYNERNCCDDGEACSTSLNRLRGFTIKKMTIDRLDITAPYKPDADTPEEIEAAEKRRQQQLVLAGSRVWSDRNGRQLAEGRLVELRDSKAIVETASGDRQPVSMEDLGNDELCFISAWYNLPSECTLGNDPYTGRNFVASTFTWKASSLCHKPLYFEEVQLERYGHTAGPLLQPAISGVHFFANIAVLPYKMGINPPNECQYTLGYYRPGSCAPWMLPPVPLSARGAAAEAGAVLGAVYLLP